MAKKTKPTFQQETAVPGESNIGYFRRILTENPKLLKRRSNDEIFERWLADHPGETEVPAKVKQALFNMKTALRKKRRGRKAAEEAVAGQEGHGFTDAPVPASPDLETLEEAIDE